MTTTPQGAAGSAAGGSGDTGPVPWAPCSRVKHHTRTATKAPPPPPGLCKKLAFHGQRDQDPVEKEAMASLTARMQIDHFAESAQRAMQKEAHEARLKGLRGLLKHLDETDWMYPSADELLGLK